MAELDNFKKTEAYTTFSNGLTALVGEPPVVYHIYHIGHSLLSGFFRRMFPGSSKRHEVLIVYFPMNMTAEVKTRIETRLGLDSIQLRYGMMASNQPPLEGEKEEQLMDREKGWVEENLEWKGDIVKGFMFLFEWRSEEGEKTWKEEEHDVIRKVGDKLPLAMDSFFRDMKELGMVGFESAHGDFFEIRAPR